MGIGSRRYYARHVRRFITWRTRVLALISVSAVVAGLVIGARIGWFYWHSHSAGGNLLREEQAEIAAARQGSSRPASHASEFDQPGLPGLRSVPSSAPPTTTAKCQNPTQEPAAGQPQGIVEAKSIGLEAPVLQGTDDAQLSVAVGHVPGSVWPGPSGTVVFSAHDVSWFSSIDKLKPGSTVSYVEPCQTYMYTVTSHAVVTAGSPVVNTVRPSLVLDTCYPLDALWLTRERYLVYADLTRVQTGGHTIQLPAATDGTVQTSLPAPVATDVGARLTTSARLGPLTLTGAPAAAWRQSIKPLNASGSALTLYFGALELAGRGDTSGWAQAAPGLGAGPIAPLWNGEVTSTVSSVSPSVAVRGSTVTGATVTSTVDVSGGNSPGTYHITMQAGVEHGVLTITSWQMTPA